jgi:uncharacterized protein (DUF2384 family)
MIEQERRNASLADDPATEAARWSEEISEARRKRARYQEMAAEGSVNFDELWERLATLEDNRKTAEQELRTQQRRIEHLARLDQDRDTLLKSYAGVMPEAIDTLGSQERHRVYRMIGMEAHLAADGSLDLSGDVMNFSQLEIPSS